MSSLKRKAFSGAIWVFLGFAVNQPIRVIGNIILTRLLAPELFGLMALVKTFIMGLELFSDIGITPNIIRSKRGTDPVFLNTAWTIQIIRGFILWFFLLIITIPVANFYQDSRLKMVMPILGLTMVIRGFQSTSIPSLTRQLKNATVTIIEVVNQVIFLTGTIIWAFFQKSIWALVGSNIIASVVQFFISHWINRKSPNRLAWEKEARKEILSYSQVIFLTTAASFLALQSDRLILGKLFPLEVLGIYTIAATLAEIPKMIMAKLSSQIIMPVIAKKMDLPRQELRLKIIKKRWLLLGVVGGIILVTSCFGDYLIYFMYDERYDDAAWMLPILALGFWPQLLTVTIDKVLYVIGTPKSIAVGCFLKFIYNIVLINLAFTYTGILGVIIVIAFNDMPIYFCALYGLWQQKMTAIRQDIQSTLLLIGLIGIVLAIRYSLGFGLPIDGILPS